MDQMEGAVFTMVVTEIGLTGKTSPRSRILGRCSAQLKNDFGSALAAHLVEGVSEIYDHGN